MRHAIYDLIDQDLVNLGQPSVTANPLPSHSTYIVLLLVGSIHFVDFFEDDDNIHMLSSGAIELGLIVLDEGHEIDGVTLSPQIFTLFSLILDVVSFQLIHTSSVTIACHGIYAPFILRPSAIEFVNRDT